MEAEIDVNRRRREGEIPSFKSALEQRERGRVEGGDRKGEVQRGEGEGR
jgi:hypothetical protein